jgi:hypothetical protein
MSHQARDISDAPRELSPAEQDAVFGGLNSQPLPPGFRLPFPMPWVVSAPEHNPVPLPW